MIITIDPRELHVPGGRSSGADPAKLQRQISRYARSSAGMPPLLVYRGSDDHYMIADGVTRAARIALLSPGTMVEAVVLGRLPQIYGSQPTIQEKLP